MISKSLYPNGKKRAVTFSYDDGTVHDIRLVEILNKYGLKGTFHLNSGIYKSDEDAKERLKIYSGHEISCHCVNHPVIENVPKEEMLFQMIEDRRRLEYAAGYPVRGMSYPYGSVNEQTVKTADACGIVYSRTVNSTDWFEPPKNFLLWDPTCHHNGGIMDKLKPFSESGSPLALFYIWGHSYEFDKNDSWELIEDFCREVSGLEDAWFATNIELYDYYQALDRIHVSADRRMIYNPSAMPVWVNVDGEAVRINGGELWRA